MIVAHFGQAVVLPEAFIHIFHVNYGVVHKRTNGDTHSTECVVPKYVYSNIDKSLNIMELEKNILAKKLTTNNAHSSIAKH